MRIRVVIVLVALAALVTPQVAAADVATDWNRTMVEALLVSHTAPQPGTRIAAIVQSSAFDAVNGVAQRYAQFRPDVLGEATPPRGTSKDAAAAGAAYTALVALFPTQKATFDMQLATTLSQLSDDSANDGGAGRASPAGWRGGRRSPTHSWRGVAPTASPQCCRRTWSGRCRSGSPPRPRSRDRRSGNSGR